MKKLNFKPIQFLIPVFIIFLATSYAKADSKEVSFKDYKEASKASDHLRFDMESTKLGMITSHFSGFVKSFKVDYTPSPEGFSGVTLRFQAKQMDTDIDGRNEKMWDKCLDAEKNPEITVSFPGVIALGESTVNGEITIRGQKKPIVAKVNVVKDGDVTKVSGSAEVSLKALEIPDPSIMVASVNDTVKIDFGF